MWRLPTDFGRVNDIPGSPRLRGQVHKGWDIGEPGDTTPDPTNFSIVDEEETLPVEINKAKVYAVANGVVSFVANDTDGDPGGIRVYITHEDGSETRYKHLYTVDNKIAVDVTVTVGTVIGLLGGSGAYSMTAYVPHLHYERINPDTGDLIEPFGDVTLSAMFQKDFSWGRGIYW